MARITNKEVGNRWERRVSDFFSDLGFDVDGGDSFLPNDKQIDVVAGRDNFLFIIECKTKHDIGKNTSLPAEIKKFMTEKLVPAISAFKDGESFKGGKFNHYSHFIPLFALNDIVLTQADYNALNIYPTLLPGGSKVWARILTNDELDYYDSIKKNLSSAIARYSLLGDYKLKFPSPQALEGTIAFKSEVNGIRIYNFVESPQNILKYANVARRVSRGKGNYQRMIEGKRCEAIIDYLDGKDENFPGGRIIPGNIILATLPEVRIEETPIEDLDFKLPYNVELVKLDFPNDYGILWVVDGQHRLYAYSKRSDFNLGLKTQHNDKIPITLLVDLNTEQQSQIFVDINDQQKGINKDYIIDIMGESEPKSPMGIISNTIKLLDLKLEYDTKNKQVNPFLHAIKIPSHGLNRKYSMKGLYEALRRFKLTSCNLRTDTPNPFFSNKSLTSFKALKSSEEELVNSLVSYFVIARRLLGTELEEKGVTDYNLIELMRGGKREGIADVMTGFYMRILIALKDKQGCSTKPQEEDFKRYLEPLQQLFMGIKSEEEFIAIFNTSGHANRDETIRKLCSYVKTVGGFGEFNFEDLNLELKTLVQRCAQLEKAMRELINDVISKDDPKWCTVRGREALPGSIYNKAYETLKEKIVKHPEIVTDGKLYKGLDLGSCKEIIKTDYNWSTYFEDVFVCGGGKFDNKEQLLTALKMVSSFRNPPMHGSEDEDYNVEDLEDPEKQKIVKGFLSIFDRVLEASGMDVDSDTELEDFEADKEEEPEGTSVC